MKRFKYRHQFKNLNLILVFGVAMISELSCQKSETIPNVFGAAALTIVNAVPNTVKGVVPVINTTQTLMWFGNAATVSYGSFLEYSPVVGIDTVYAVQNFSKDTLNTSPKAGGQIFYNVLEFKKGGIYSLLLCGSDTSSTDYLFIQDSLPNYSPGDSVTGIRFVNLSSGSNPISINLEGNSNGSEVANLSYKGITSFKQYLNNSTTLDYFFVIRDAVTGDSLTQFDFVNSGSYNNGHGLSDVTNNNFNSLLTFKNITIALIGQPGSTAVVPQSTIVIDNF